MTRPQELEIKITARGFKWAEWIDAYGSRCTIQESSSADKPKLWFGHDESRAHLDQEQVRMLLPLLQSFVDTGKLP